MNFHLEPWSIFRLEFFLMYAKEELEYRPNAMCAYISMCLFLSVSILKWLVIWLAKHLTSLNDVFHDSESLSKCFLSKIQNLNVQNENWVTSELPFHQINVSINIQKKNVFVGTLIHLLPVISIKSNFCIVLKKLQ